MEIIWILVANASDARVFSMSSAKSGLLRVIEKDQPISRLKVREVVTDKPGRIFSSKFQIKHGLAAEEDPRERITRMFAKELAQMLERLYAKQRFDELVLVAEPSFMGKLKGYLSKNIASRVAMTVNKDLTHFSDREVAAHLEEVLREIWRDPRRWDPRGFVMR
jgi:protein required for attachment to host cells